MKQQRRVKNLQSRNAQTEVPTNVRFVYGICTQREYDISSKQKIGLKVGGVGIFYDEEFDPTLKSVGGTYVFSSLTPRSKL